MTTADGPPAIELRRLSKTYRGGGRAVPAVADVSLRIAPGEVLALLGPNGAGKTTMIKMLCGLVTPSSGAVSVHGYDVARQRREAVRRIGAVLEGSRNVYWPLSAWENLLYFGRLKGMHTAEIKPRAEWLLRELGLWERRHETVGSYSRGMQQKVAVSAALITDPPILLLDEPTIGLDVESARTFKDWIARLTRDERKTIVLTTHQLPIAQELANRIAVIREGTIIADLPTTELLSRHAEDRYEVRVAGSLDGLADAFPAGSEISRADGQARVRLPDDDLAVLYGVLDEVRAAGSTLIAVDKARPTLEEVFLRLLREDVESVSERTRVAGGPPETIRSHQDDNAWSREVR